MYIIQKSYSDCPRYYPKKGDHLSFVCVCSGDVCEQPLQPILPNDVRPGHSLLYRTAISGDRLARYVLKTRRMKNAHYKPKGFLRLF